MISILAAFQFLTIIPTMFRRPFTSEELGRAVGCFPVVGLALGAIFFGAHRVLRTVLPPQLNAALILIIWITLTRALHFDGFLDTCDGLFGGFTPVKRLEIMRDSRVGAFAVTGGGLLLITKYSAILTLSTFSGLLLAPILGRWVLVMAIFFFPYARQQGLGREMKDNIHWLQVFLATGFTVLAVWYIAEWTGLLALGIAGTSLWITAKYFLHLIPGLTGDSYGALCELTELVILVYFSSGFTI
jgi:adenosylcobinamide-GDP ribazoletransferase